MGFILKLLYLYLLFYKSHGNLSNEFPVKEIELTLVILYRER